MTVLTEKTSTAGPTVPGTMRAAVLFGPGDFRIVDKPVPQPGEADVLVKIAMCGTCGTDLKIQEHPFPGQPPFGQFTPGHEWTGTVVRLGPGVDEFAVGDRVAIEAHKGCGRCDNCIVGKYTACLNNGNRAKGHRATGFTADGGFAEYAVHHINALYKMPESVSWEDAVLVTTAGTGLYGLDVAGGFIAGESIVVIGPGPVGLMTVQVCKALGAGRVILVGTRDSRLQLGARLGADATVNARQEDPVAAVKRLVGRNGADMVIESSGALDAPQQCVQMVRRAGRLLFLAFYREKVTFDLSLAIQNDVTLFTSRGEGGGNVKRALALAAEGKIRGRDLVTHHFPLEEINEGFRVVREREGDPIKVVFVP
ncbi:MAG: alcohol dehydrogenase catalytic domain-containing protein [Chloroflexi bacterium]|nr:alcohol dehydrogenase catalytic domain-containing protein [Chloroflexota bacterium]